MRKRFKLSAKNDLKAFDKVIKLEVVPSVIGRMVSGSARSAWSLCSRQLKVDIVWTIEDEETLEAGMEGLLDRFVLLLDHLACQSNRSIDLLPFDPTLVLVMLGRSTCKGLSSDDRVDFGVGFGCLWQSRHTTRTTALIFNNKQI
jgi:hypothetical protein